MKLRLGSGLIPINLLALLIIIIIILVPSNIFLVVLAFPFVLFSPGYALTTALHPRKNNLSGVERIAFSFGLSLTAIALIGLALNYMPFGIQLYSIMFSIEGFVLVVSAIAELRRSRLHEDERFLIVLELHPVSWKSKLKLDRVLSVILVVSALVVISSAIFIIVVPKIGQSFTEFYVLDSDGQTTDYPLRFIMSEGKVVTVIYSAGQAVPSDLGYVNISIDNQEHKNITYELNISIDGQASAISIDSALVPPPVTITLKQGQKWQQQVGFAPDQLGDNQEVDFILLVDGKPYFDDPLHLWVDVTSQN